MESSPITDADTAAAAHVTPASVRRFRIAVALAFLVNGAAFASWASRIPALRAGMGLDDGTLGAALLALAMGVLCSFALTPRGVRLLGARRITLLAGAAELVLLPGPFLVHSPSSLALVLFEFGLANGAMDVSMNVLAVAAQDRAGKPIMSGLHGLWSLGGAIGAVAGSIAARAGVLPPAHLAIAGTVLGLVLLASWRLAPTDASRAPGAGTAGAAARRPMRLDVVLAGLGLVCFCSFLVEGAMADWSGVLLRTRLHASESFAALGYAVFAGAMMITRLLGDRLVARWGLGPAALLSALASAALVLGLAAASRSACLVAFALTGFGLATVVPTCFSAAARHVAERSARAGHDGGEAAATAAIAWVSGFGYFGMLLGPPVIGALAQASTLQVAFGLLVVLLAVIAILGPGLTRGRLQARSSMTTPARA